MTMGDISDGKAEYGIGAPASEYFEGSPRYLRISDIGDNYRLLYNDIKGVNSEEILKYLLSKGDIVFARTGNTTGKSYLYNENDGELIYAGFLIKFHINDLIMNSKFLSYVVQSDRYWNWIKSMSLRSGQPGINSKEYSAFLVQIPSLNEQSKIADLLNSVDDMIYKIENRVDNLIQLKAALAKKLLAEGIGHTELIDSEIGKIPAKWGIKKIAEIADVKGGKRLPKGFTLVDEDTGIPYIRVSDMYMGGINLDGIKYVPLEVADKIKRYKISKDDLFISVAGTLGIVGEVPEELDNANLTENADKLCNIKCDKTYLCYYLQSDYFKKMVESVMTIGAQPKLALTRITEFNVALPDMSEQKEIAHILKNMDLIISNYTAQRYDYTQLKRG